MSEVLTTETEPFADFRRLLRITRFAGSVIRYGFENPRDNFTEAKMDGSPVSWADVSADAVLQRLLRESYPTAKIYSEEAEQPVTPVTCDSYWIVDPLDCTRAFLDGMPHHFCVTFSKIEKVDSIYVPVVGVVYDPISEEGWLAAAGKGSWFVSGNRVVRAIAAPSNDISILIENASSRNELVRVIGEACAISESQVVPQGSALKCRQLIDISGSFYIRPTPQKEWDVAALSLICQESGMFVSDFMGDDLRFNSLDWCLPTGICFLPSGAEEKTLSIMRRLCKGSDPDDLVDYLI